jgi:hypothetical protein
VGKRYIHAGLRFNEAAALRWVDLNLTDEHPFVHVCRGGWGGVPGPTKSGRVRDIPLSDPLVKELARLPRIHELVFPQQKGREMMNPASKAKYLHKFCRLGGLKPCGWHTLRHTFGTRLAALGVPIPVLQKLMGHANIKMTMRYVHVDPMSVLASVAAIERAIPVPWHLAGASPNQSPNQRGENAASSLTAIINQGGISAEPSKTPTGHVGALSGAGRGSRTLISTLARWHNSRYTIPACAPPWAELRRASPPITPRRSTQRRA